MCVCVCVCVKYYNLNIMSSLELVNSWNKLYGICNSEAGSLTRERNESNVVLHVCSKQQLLYDI